MYAVIFETGYKTRIEFEGTKAQCIRYMIDNELDEITYHIEELEIA
jgi:hypothetical protein